MKVVYTDEALSDLQSISDWLAVHYPSIATVVAQRIGGVIAHLSRWPESARRVPERPGVRAMPIGRYPYVVFYDVTPDAVRILHIHHAARRR